MKPYFFRRAAFVSHINGARGVFAHKNGEDHLYLLQYKGAGALDTQGPHAFYYVNATTGTVVLDLFDAYTDWAWRGLAITGDASQLIALEMSWSVDAVNTFGTGPSFNRLIRIPLVNGVPGMIVPGAIVDPAGVPSPQWAMNGTRCPPSSMCDLLFFRTPE